MDDWLDVAWGSSAAEMGPSVARVAGAGEERARLAGGASMTAIADNGGNIFNMKVTNRNPLFFEFRSISKCATWRICRISWARYA